MLTFVVETAFAILGIVGFYTGFHVLTYIGGAAVLVLTVRELIFGELRSLTTEIVAGLIGIFCVGRFLLGICIGLCFESVIMEIVTILFFVF